ncbi:MAG: type II toxin-antitoxin system death-on-curing family toxin [Bauldia sp.]
MKPIEWLDLAIVLDIHTEQLALFGGGDGVRDVGLLESALARPLNKHAYGETNLSALAAAYAFGISGNHPFMDGNKRSAFASIITFLGLNEVDFDIPPAEATAIMFALASGDVDEVGLARWMADNMPRGASVSGT